MIISNFSAAASPTATDPTADDSRQSEAGKDDESKEKSQVMMYIPKLKNSAHFFEYTDDEFVDLLEQNKDKEVMLLRSTETIQQVMGNENSFDCLLDEALSCSVIPPLAQSTEMRDEGMIPESLLRTSEERIKRLENDLAVKTQQYNQLHQMYIALQQKLANVMTEMQKQRYIFPIIFFPSILLSCSGKKVLQEISISAYFVMHVFSAATNKRAFRPYTFNLISTIECTAPKFTLQRK